MGDGGDDSSREGDSVGGFGALPRWEHPLAQELYCDHRYHTIVPPRLVLIEVWRRPEKTATHSRRKQVERPRLRSPEERKY